MYEDDHDTNTNRSRSVQSPVTSLGGQGGCWSLSLVPSVPPLVTSLASLRQSIRSLASSIGIEDLVQSVGRRRFLLPDGSERYLVDEAMLVHLTEELGGQLADPIKTTVVQKLRSMTTWVVRKGRPEMNIPNP